MLGMLGLLGWESYCNFLKLYSFNVNSYNGYEYSLVQDFFKLKMNFQAKVKLKY